MQNFYRKIVNHPRIILTIFVIAALCGAVIQGMVAVNYDMNDYLPAESASTRALELLGEEFEGGIPNARVMVRDVSIADEVHLLAGDSGDGHRDGHLDQPVTALLL